MRWCHLQESCSVAVKPCVAKVCVFAVRHQTPHNPTGLQIFASYHDRLDRNRFCLTRSLTGIIISIVPVPLQRSFGHHCHEQAIIRRISEDKQNE